MTSRVLSALLVAVLALSALSGSAQPVRYTSLDGSRSLTFITPPAGGGPAPVRILYSSPAGTIQVKVAGHKIALGDLVLVSSPSPDGDNGRRVLTATLGKRNAKALLAPDTCAQTSGQMSDVSPIFQAFTRTDQGPALQSLAAFIRDEVLPGRSVADGVLQQPAASQQSAGSSAPDVPAMLDIHPLDGMDCVMAILNQVAASAAMVAGCEAGGLWCVSGVAWWLESQMQTGRACSGVDGWPECPDCIDPAP